jgi:hypothetical protein
MTLLHRDYTAPVVEQNSGYNVSTRGSRSSITILTEGNQLSMEHRYFLPSRPAPADWTKLNIEQAANDQHRITDALKARIYAANKWLTTGASKGGMTSLFHRRFFPNDVDATVAFVAPFDYPADAVQSPTNRYFVFLENVGTSPTCRQKLKDFQNVVLARRDAMKTRMRAVASFTLLGEDRALEFAVEELPFIFWQYGSQSDCAAMTDVQSWIASSGERIMLIYGQNDPWTAGAVDLGAATDSFKFIAPGGNHGSGIGSLTTADENTAIASVLRWAGVPQSKRTAKTSEQTTEQEELALRRRRR